MEIVTIIFSVFLAVLAVLFVIIAPGLIARLIFRKANEIRLRNTVALFTLALYSLRPGFADDLYGSGKSFANGLESESWIPVVLMMLFVLFMFYLFQCSLVGIGIKLANKLLSKNSPTKTFTLSQAPPA